MVEEGDKSMDMIAQAQLAADRLEKANAMHIEIMKRVEAMEARNILGGKSTATEPVIEKKVETPAEYAKRMLRGGV